MSRTIRRKNVTFCSYSNKLVHSTYIKWFGKWIDLQHSIGTNEYRIGKIISQSDSATTTHKEPGPSWFRNLMSERPLRRKHKNELRKFKINPDYEPDIVDKGRLQYWT